MAITEKIFAPVASGGGAPSSGQTIFTFEFNYISVDDVYVTIDDVISTDYVLNDGENLITFNTAPADGTVVRIYRETGGDDPIVNFYSGASIRADDLNDNFRQNLYTIQETNRSLSNAVIGTFPDQSITTAKLVDSAVTNVKLATDAVSETKILNGAVTNSKLDTDAVDTANVVDSAITDAKIGDNVLTPYLSSINDGPVSGFRNALINGNFSVWNRGTTFTNAANTYTADRWRIATDGVGTNIDVNWQPFTPGLTEVPGEPNSYIRIDQTVAGSGATFTDIRQYIENVRTFNGQTVTVTFYAKAQVNTTINGIRLTQRFGTGGSPSSDVATQPVGSINVTTSWAKYTYTFSLPSVSGKTIGTNEDDSLEFRIRLPLNSVYRIDIAQIQLELGPVSTPFERRSVPAEKLLCSRYFLGPFQPRTYLGNATGTANIWFPFPTQMRRVPDINYTLAAGSSPSVANLTTMDVNITGTVTTAGTNNRFGLDDLTLNAEY